MSQLISRDYKQTITARAERDPEFAKALQDEAHAMSQNGESEVSQLLTACLQKGQGIDPKVKTKRLKSE